MAISVLIVDDHPTMRQSVKTFLDLNEDIEVIGDVGNMEDALSFVEKQTPDVILIDVRLGESDGMTLASELRRRGVESVLIGLSLYHQPEVRERMIEAGADAYIDKSADPSELVALIRESVEKKR